MVALVMQLEYILSVPSNEQRFITGKQLVLQQHLQDPGWNCRTVGVSPGRLGSGLASIRLWIELLDPGASPLGLPNYIFIAVSKN